VVGNINRDIKAMGVPSSERIFKDGETSLPLVEETVGGGGANSACAAAALGARAGFVGKVGSDPLGARLEETITKWGVQSFLARSNATTTGTTLALNYLDGHRHFLSCLPNNASLSFENLDLSALASYRHLLRADIWFSESMLFGGNQKLFAATRAASISTSIDLNWDPQWGSASAGEIKKRKKAIHSILPNVTLAHGNARELCEFTEKPDLPSALRHLAGAGLSGVLVHLGREGAGYFDGKSYVTAPCSPVGHIQNSTGCGDVLSTCFMLLQEAEMQPLEKLQMANQVVAQFMEGKLKLIPQLS
jgi:sugar/nucleoside kinase (ribokinase family)